MFSKLIEIIRHLPALLGDEGKIPEERVREEVIEPFLNILGWRIEDGSLSKKYVIKHHRETINIDYVLRINRIPVAYVLVYEMAKPLVLDGKVKDLLVLSRSPRNIVLTNGLEWVLLVIPNNVFEQPIINGRFSLLINEHNIYDFLSNTLKLVNPLVFLKQNPLWLWMQEYIRKQHQTPRSKCEKAVLLKNYEKEKHGLPKYVIMPDGSVFSINHWNEWLVKTVKWLYKKGYIAEKDLPIKLPRGRTYILNRKPLHPKGKRFRSATRIARGIYLEKNVGSEAVLKRILFLLRKYGIKPNDVLLCF
ncbi:hypothetical protein Smar_0078 [Staphylothermus marinus F1]|uniref:Type I restriction enzyme R protein N-terminal domain-containing protein n=1 Tax=Staphylothermus marinus (strain ATCC 43588 / DSM 3639 / JCM 9404 / F1) TaxID=399550 RepID=A3DKN1_STAMF|nr:hypothetical protein [Staphylothermus marinus]ABN69191.1 hypothetical protein Smar_0078 [Staphylothermus marinus F1]